MTVTELALVAFECEQVITTLLDYLLCDAGLAYPSGDPT